jgi:serine protease Do
LSLAAALAASRREQAPDTPEVFRRYAGLVVKVQVVERSSGTKATVGSGFLAGPDGLVVTNYHVVASLVHEPERYRATLVDGDGGDTITLLAIDVVHDLAVLATGERPSSWFTAGMAAAAIPQGLRLYALGHPADEGLAIVEGTYNGPLPHTLYERLRFTGSLNPGMSGGPAITREGRVVGINVSTRGNQLSYLVPVTRAGALLAKARAGSAIPTDWRAEAGRQIREYQDVYLSDLLHDSTPTTTLGPWRVPTRPAAFFDCWADGDRDEDRPWEAVDHSCSTNDDIFVSRDQSSGVINFEHRLLTSARLGALRFRSLYSRELNRDWHTHNAGSEDVTDYECRSGHVRRGKLRLHATFCVRRYRHFEGLYDVIFRLAPLGRRDAGLVATLTMTGVTMDNARRMAARYAERLVWAE